MTHPEQARVIVTGDVDGLADYHELMVTREVELDEDGQPAYLASQLWGTPDGVPIVGSGMAEHPVTDPWFPQPGGARFRLFTFQPSSSIVKEPSPKQEGSQGAANEQSNFLEAYDPERPGMHISDSVDFVHVLSGEIVLELERREVLLKTGDMVVMRGTWHKWRNESPEPCTVSSVMIGAARSEPGNE